jgi:MFS superfamily sulfate permease-like transporter
MTPGSNRFDRMEWAGAFGDLGTLVPFVAAYITILKMDPLGILLAFGVSMVACGWFYRTPFPVQPMKAIGAVAITQAAQISALNGNSVIAASLVTGVIWLLLGVTGLAGKISRMVPREVMLGIVLGLGMSFMLQGARMMGADWPVACAAFLVVILLKDSKVFPAMFVLLLGGFAYSIAKDPALLAQIGNISIGFRMPHPDFSSISLNDLLYGAVFLALPQLPLTLGNAIIGIREENNRLFPDRSISIKGVATSTGIMNLFSAAIGGIPLCHGAGGMAAHVSFGARTGGASIILGSILIALALAFSGSIELLFQVFPVAVLGVILFFAGLLLAVANMPGQASRQQIFITVATAGMATWNVGAALVLGMLLHLLARHGRLGA